MILFLLTLSIFGLSIAAMAVGVIGGRLPLGGGCGSVNGCDGCSRECSTKKATTEA